MSERQAYYESLQVPLQFVNTGAPAIGMTIGHGIARLVRRVEEEGLVPDLGTLKVEVLPWQVQGISVHKIIATMEGSPE